MNKRMVSVLGMFCVWTICAQFVLSAETIGQKNAVRSAKTYLSVMAFSQSGLAKQLVFDGFSEEDAAYGAANCKADWNAQAAKSAKVYLETMPMSKKGLFDQLLFDGYTQEQAEHGASAVGY